MSQFHDGMYVNGVWLDHIDKTDVRRAYFVCPECGDLFLVLINKVRYGIKTKCNYCTGKNKYREGHRYGPNNILLTRLLDDGKAEFVCPLCNKKFIAIRSAVNNGTTKSCGCLRSIVTSERNSEGKDLIGKKFGHLTVIRRADECRSTKDRHYYWECECDCDEYNHVIVPTNHLRSGLTTSCGCVHKAAVRKALMNDLTGQKFGHLTVLYQASDYVLPSNRTRIAWHCRCDCIDGKHRYLDVQTADLSSGKRIACSVCTKRMSHGEILVHDILKEFNIEFITQKTFDDCRSDIGGYLKFDFFLPSENICIEYDGEQHYHDNGVFDKVWTSERSSYQSLHRRDLIKNEWCASHHIRLIRIPYTYYDDLRNNHQLLIDIINNEHTVVLPEYDET